MPHLARRPQAAVSLEHGIDDRTSVGALARMMLIDDEHVTFVEGIGPALDRSGDGRSLRAPARIGGGSAARAQMLGKFGPVNVSAKTLIANDFHLQGGRPVSIRDQSLSLDAPLRDRPNGASRARRCALDRPSRRQQPAGGRRPAVGEHSTASISQPRSPTTANISTMARPRPVELNLDFIGSGHIGAVRVRGETNFDIAPHAQLREADLSAYWSASENVDWEGDPRLRCAGSSRPRRSHPCAALPEHGAWPLPAEAATDGSVAFGINLNFSLDPAHGFAMSRQPLAQAGIVHALVYRDLNDNGIREPSEPWKRARSSPPDRGSPITPTNAEGAVTVGGLSAVHAGRRRHRRDKPATIRCWCPGKRSRSSCRVRALPAEVEIGLVGGGDIEGAVVKSGGLGFEGLDLELVDAAGKVVGTARTDFDGFFLFERVAYGKYSVRVAKDSAAAAKILPTLISAPSSRPTRRSSGSVRFSVDQHRRRLAGTAREPAASR